MLKAILSFSCVRVSQGIGLLLTVCSIAEGRTTSIMEYVVEPTAEKTSQVVMLHDHYSLAGP